MSPCRSASGLSPAAGLLAGELVADLVQLGPHLAGQLLYAALVDQRQNRVGIHEGHCDGAVLFLPHHHIAGQQQADIGIGLERLAELGG